MTITLDKVQNNAQNFVDSYIIRILHYDSVSQLVYELHHQDVGIGSNPIGVTKCRRVQPCKGQPAVYIPLLLIQ